MHQIHVTESSSEQTGKITEPYKELELSLFAALETYSNVHRGSGHFSMVSTRLFEQARDIVLEYLGLKKGRYKVIFCTPGGAAVLQQRLTPENYQLISSQEIGLSLGVKAMVITKKALKKTVPAQTGGGTTVIMSPDWVIWAAAPDRFEAGTPAVINIIAFARALQLISKHGKEIFINHDSERLTASDILYTDELKEYSGQRLLEELRKSMIGNGLIVPTAEGPVPYINLDNSASTPAFTPSWNAFRNTLHQPLPVKKEIINEVRSICSGILGAPVAGYDIFFTSNTTEAINLAAESFSHEPSEETKPVVLSTLLEHSSNDLPWRQVASSVIRLSIDRDGFVDLTEMENLLTEYNLKGLHGNEKIKLVAVSGASNVLGVYNDLEEISRLTHKYGAQLLVDAAQMVAHRKIGMQHSGIDYLAFSAHKVYAPFGTGVLISRKGLLNFNEEELDKIKSFGEENSAGIAALGKSLVLIERIGLDLIRDEEQALTKRALTGLKQIKGVTVYGINDPDSHLFNRKGGVIVFFLKGTMSNRVAELLAEQRGIGIRSGCHCAHILVKHILNISPGLEKFQKIIFRFFSGLRPPGVARISFGIENNAMEIDILISVLNRIAEKKLIAKGDIKHQINNFIQAASHKVFN